MVKGPESFFCSNQDCRFALWRGSRYFDPIGKKIIKQIVEELLGTGKMNLRKYRSREYGKAYDVILLLDTDDKGRAAFRMEFPDRKGEWPDRIRSIEKVRSEMNQAGSRIIK